MLKDVAKRPFITVGFSAFVLLIPLALTSTAWSIRRLGGRNWQRLHRLIYFTGILAVVHYTWLVKADHRKPIEYGIVLSVLLLYRVGVWVFRKSVRKEQAARHPSPSPESPVETGPAPSPCAPGVPSSREAAQERSPRRKPREPWETDQPQRGERPLLPLRLIRDGHRIPILSAASLQETPSSIFSTETFFYNPG